MKERNFFESQNISTEKLFYSIWYIYIYLINKVIHIWFEKKACWYLQSVSRKIDVTLCTFYLTCIYPIIMPDNADKNIKVKEIERKRQTEIVPIT